MLYHIIPKINLSLMSYYFLYICQNCLLYDVAYICLLIFSTKSIEVEKSQDLKLLGCCKRIHIQTRLILGILFLLIVWVIRTGWIIGFQLHLVQNRQFSCQSTQIFSSHQSRSLQTHKLLFGVPLAYFERMFPRIFLHIGQ